MTPSVALVGFMGAGKTSVGRAVARRLDRPFVDTDSLIRLTDGPIETLFESVGEPGFRRIEAERVREALDRARGEACVVSLGGGAVTIPEVRERLAGVPTVIWLDAPVDQLYRRARSPRRPLTADEDRFKALYAERVSLYRAVATATLRTSSREPVSRVVERVLETVRSSEKDLVTSLDHDTATESSGGGIDG